MGIFGDAWDRITGIFSSDPPEEVVGACPDAISPEAAQALFDDMAAQVDIPFDYPPDCCYARAQRMAQLMSDRGIASKKAWVYGSLNPVTSSGDPVRFPPTPSGDVVTWGYHVAPTVSVRQPDGSCRDMVIDPSLRDRPLTISEWEETMGGGTMSRLTPSDTYLYRPDAGYPPLTQDETTDLLGADSGMRGAFAAHVDTRDSVLGR